MTCLFALQVTISVPFTPKSKTMASWRQHCRESAGLFPHPQRLQFPDGGRIFLPRTTGMAAYELQFCVHAVFATIVGDLHVMTAALLAVLGVHWSVLLLAGPDGELIEMLPATDRWVLPVNIWLYMESSSSRIANNNVNYCCTYGIFSGQQNSSYTGS